jgi:hypothetical protein
VPTFAPEGIVMLTIITRLNVPKPELTLASKKFTGGGVVLSVGMTNGYEMLLIGYIHVEYEPYEAATLLMHEALLGS